MCVVVIVVVVMNRYNRYMLRSRRYDVRKEFFSGKHILHESKLADFVRIIHIFTPVQNLDLFTKTSKVRQKECEHYLFENRKC